jgi:hypothetical protein
MADGYACAASRSSAADRHPHGGAEGDSQSVAGLAALTSALGQLGWTDGQNIRIDIRWAAGNALSTQTNRDLIIPLVARHRLLTVYPYRYWFGDGVSYPMASIRSISIGGCRHISIAFSRAQSLLTPPSRLPSVRACRWRR